MSHGTQQQGSRAQGPGRSNGEGQSANWFVYWAPILFHEVPWKEPVPEPGKVTQHPVLQKGVWWHLLSLPRPKHGDRPEPAERSQERAEAESTRWEWTRGKKHTTSLLLKYSKESQRTGRKMGGRNLEQYRKVQKRKRRSRNKETAKAGPLLPGSSLTVRETGRSWQVGTICVPFHTKLHFPQNVPLQRISVSKAVYL